MLQFFTDFDVYHKDETRIILTFQDKSVAFLNMVSKDFQVISDYKHALEPNRPAEAVSKQDDFNNFLTFF